MKGIVGGTAPAPNAPKIEMVAVAVFNTLSPTPTGRAQLEPVFRIKPISEEGNVANVEPSNGAVQAICKPELPEPVNLLIFQTAFTTVCFCAGVNGVPVIAP